ncbi:MULTISPECIES: LPXTG cell wall anchor domain-containing protein [Streptomyces]|uniref:LPXTG cell wall anchor domain-containing protein n=1 Tax=Streptomyces broussonetiae TaxID=2686304 RepID=A0ABV5EG52_9ACTN|nr:LPXTG cell wall anchor domain-containing protein [Streptomyces sp. B93]MBC7273345.1 LPXTG cell wall anchor domain-containing protein [Streptomyces sp.]MBQ1089956.1 LPXTG cell wall anchor domain-containing protein [Streptomyces sp. B93]
MTHNGSLAHTGVSWPLYAIVGLAVAGGGALMRLVSRARGR